MRGGERRSTHLRSGGPGRVRVSVCEFCGLAASSPWLLLRVEAHSFLPHPFQFPDIVEFSETMANAGKTVIVAALDGTFQRKVGVWSRSWMGPGRHTALHRSLSFSSAQRSLDGGALAKPQALRRARPSSLVCQGVSPSQTGALCVRGWRSGGKQGPGSYLASVLVKQRVSKANPPGERGECAHLVSFPGT